jgi:excisionase family DNA binding protein
MKVREAAVRLNVTLTYIYALLQAERLAGASKTDGEWNIPVDTIEAYDQQRRRGRLRADSTNPSEPSSLGHEHLQEATR